MKPLRQQRRVAGALLAGALAIAACGGDDDSAAPTSTEPDGGELVAQVASYDLVAGRAQRVVVGLLTNDQELVGFGTVEFAFSYLGTREAPLDDPRPGPTATADYRLVPGQPPATPTDEPVFVDADARGVYGADDITFPDAGLWQVEVTATVESEERSATAALEVLADSAIPAPGDEAPRSQNHLPGAEGVPPTAIDSRAEDDGTVPDPQLHDITVADAIASGRPVMVVVSTPVYCVSRFCGPITDTIAELAREQGDAMHFVHLEVWRDFEGRAINAAAADWIYPTREGDAAEPWVFVVGRDGRITHRFDNVATDPELRAAVEEVLA